MTEFFVFVSKSDRENIYCHVHFGSIQMDKRDSLSFSLYKLKPLFPSNMYPVVDMFSYSSTSLYFGDRRMWKRRKEKRVVGGQGFSVLPCPFSVSYCFYKQEGVHRYNPSITLLRQPSLVYNLPFFM